MNSRHHRHRHPLIYVALGTLLLYSIVAFLVWRGVPLHDMLPLGIVAQVHDFTADGSDPPAEGSDSPATDPGSAGAHSQGADTAEAAGQETEQPWEPPPGPSLDDVVGPDPGYGAWPTSNSLPDQWRDPEHQSRAVDDPVRSALRILAGQPSDGEVAGRVARPSKRSERLLLDALRLLEEGRPQGP